MRKSSDAVTEGRRRGHGSKQEVMATTPTYAPTMPPWDGQREGLICPACPDHDIRAEFLELVIDGTGIHEMEDRHAALRVTRRGPGIASGASPRPLVLERMSDLLIVDFLERQLFKGEEARRVADQLAARFPGATVHVWLDTSKATKAMADDATWQGGDHVIIRAPSTDLPPHEYPYDVAWAAEPEHVQAADGRAIDLWRGCLYVDPLTRELVRFGWSGLTRPHPRSRRRRRPSMPA